MGYVLRHALVNGAAGLIFVDGEHPFAVWGFTVAGGKIVEIDTITDSERLDRFGLAVVSPSV